METGRPRQHQHRLVPAPPNPPPRPQSPTTYEQKRGLPGPYEPANQTRHRMKPSQPSDEFGSQSMTPTPSPINPNMNFPTGPPQISNTCPQPKRHESSPHRHTPQVSSITEKPMKPHSPAPSIPAAFCPPPHNAP
ncbi:hypothetical protein AMECASPLE_029533 [Ameca splendens]|uniref:Uncharacterized protein n=1 Tax=Ameca splendens TaxID=208324 RepID=A0ABV0YH83_9TELE